MIHPADRAFDPTHFFQVRTCAGATSSLVLFISRAFKLIPHQEILAVSEDDDAGVINMDAASKWEELKTRGIASSLITAASTLNSLVLTPTCSAQKGLQEALTGQVELLCRS